MQPTTTTHHTASPMMARRKPLSLSERLRIVRVAECHLLWGKSIRETADIHSVSVGTVINYVRRAMTFGECAHLIGLAESRAKTRPAPGQGPKP